MDKNEPEWVFNNKGDATAIDCGDCLYDRNGRFRLWISGNNLYNTRGYHVGWVEGGVFYDRNNRVLGFTLNRTGYIPYMPGVHGVSGMPGFGGRPGRPGFSGVPGRPGYSGWSDILLEDYIAQ